jgi:hypothetical protein
MTNKPIDQNLFVHKRFSPFINKNKQKKKKFLLRENNQRTGELSNRVEYFIFSINATTIIIRTLNVHIIVKIVCTKHQQT